MRSQYSVARRPLVDRLCPRPRILFVGINPSLRSAEVGHHFAGPGNPFWRLLHAAGLVPAPMTYADDVRLPALGLALTNIVPRATRAASELTAADYVEGRRRLERLIARLRPAVVALVGATVYREFAGPGAAGGCGPKPDLQGARVFVVPNPSGLNAAYPGFRDKLVWYRALRRFAARSAPEVPAARAPFVADCLVAGDLGRQRWSRRRMTPGSRSVSEAPVA